MSDSAFRYSVLGYTSESVAAMIENLVYLELLRRGYDVNVGKFGVAEIDFVATKQENKLYVQVAERITSEETERREYSTLLSIPDNYPKYVLRSDVFAGGNYQGIKTMHIADLREHGVKLKLHPKSLIMLAGGWKRFFAERLEKPELYALSEEVLGVGEARIREFFGAVEHPIVFADCPNHHLHVPIYSRVIIRDAFTLEPAGYGTPGLLNLLTPMITSMPFTSVMTDDLAALHPGGECGCGIKSPFLEIFGRVGMADIKTCAASAAELLTDTLKGAGS